MKLFVFVLYKAALICKIVKPIPESCHSFIHLINHLFKKLFEITFLWALKFCEEWKVKKLGWGFCFGYVKMEKSIFPSWWDLHLAPSEEEIIDS